MKLLSKSKIFLICCIVFILGIAIASFLPFEYVQYDLVWFSGLVSLIAALILFWNNFKQTRKHLVFILGLFFLFLAFWRYSIAIPQNTPDKIWYYNNLVVEISGLVANEPNIREKNQKLEIEAQEIQYLSKDWISIEGKILVSANLYPKYQYGDTLSIKCQLKAPQEFNGFAYDRYLARLNVYSVCYYPQIKYLSANNGNRFFALIFKFKNKLREIINQGLTEPEASLARAIILGDKKGIPPNLRDQFSQAGISHIAAISGMHISILSALVMGALFSIGLSRNRAFYFAIIFLLGYIILIGLPASAMRAGIMGTLLLWSLKIGRLNRITNSLSFAAVILLLINPRLLRDDIGFQLSFLAVLGIINFYPILDQLSSRLIFKYFINFKYLNIFLKFIFSVINISIAAQIFILPIIAMNFSQISIIAPISNLLILWALPVLMIACVTGICLSLFLPALSPLFFLPAFLLLKYIIITTKQLIGIPYAYIEIDYLPFVWVIFYYLSVSFLLWRANLKKD